MLPSKSNIARKVFALGSSLKSIETNTAGIISGYCRNGLSSPHLWVLTANLKLFNLSEPKLVAQLQLVLQVLPVLPIKHTHHPIVNFTRKILIYNKKSW